MRWIASLLVGLALVTPALAQQQQEQRPVDHGPFTPEANRAYQGGGVILQGAPGAERPPASDAVNLPPASGKQGQRP